MSDCFTHFYKQCPTLSVTRRLPKVPKKESILLYINLTSTLQLTLQVIVLIKSSHCKYQRYAIAGAIEKQETNFSAPLTTKGNHDVPVFKEK